MTAIAYRRDDTLEGPAWLRGPEEGWLAVIALTVMVGTVAEAIDTAHWAGFVPQGPSETGFLIPAMLLAAAWGAISAKLGWPTLAAHVAGAAIGAAVLLLAVAAVVAPGTPTGASLTALSDSVYRFYHDLVIDGVRSSETSVFLLVLGAAMWTVAQLAAFNLFARHRGLAAVALTGVALFVELSVSAQDQYGYLVVFAVAALVLLMRMNLLDQRVGWVRRGIGDQGAVATLYTRSGVTFIAIALVGALALTATASSAPLAGVLNQPGVRDQLVNLGVAAQHAGRRRGGQRAGAEFALRLVLDDHRPVGRVTRSRLHRHHQHEAGLLLARRDVRHLRRDHLEAGRPHQRRPGRGRCPGPGGDRRRRHVADRADDRRDHRSATSTWAARRCWPPRTSSR